MLPVRESPVGAFWDRLTAAILVGSAAYLVWLLALVPPDPRGYGTHEALGMAPCRWPADYGIPCPTCGMTTAACHLVHLQPVKALWAQPFGALLALAGILAALVALHDLVRGRSLVARLYGRRWGVWLLGAVALFLAAWLHKYAVSEP